MNMKRITGLVLATIMLLPILVAATVVISYTYPTSTASNAPICYLEQGPNYATANAMGFIYAPQSGSPSNIISGTKIYINTTAGAGTVYLLNVLEIVNNTKSNTIYSIVWINYTSSTPVYFTLYWGSSEMGFNGNVVTGYSGSVTYSTSTTTSGAISLSGIADLYLTIEISGSVSGSGTLTVQYKTA